MKSMKLILALELRRTTAIFGHHHYCHKHRQIVDHQHLDECDLIKNPKIKNSAIVAPLTKVETIWEMEPQEFKMMEEHL
jgi:hypothetical protein